MQYDAGARITIITSVTIFIVIFIIIGIFIGMIFISITTSYYRLICWDFLSCPAELEEQEQRPWQVIVMVLVIMMVRMITMILVMMLTMMVL